MWQSRISLVFHEPSQVQGQPVHVNERIFKIYGMGGFAICDDNPCLREYFSDDELVTASCPEEMIEKAKYYLQHPKERQSIARRGHHAVLQRHTYTHRARHLLDTLTLYEGQ